MGSEDVKCLPIPLSHGLSHSLKIACTQIFLVTFLLSGSTPPSLVLWPLGEGGGELENTWDQKGIWLTTR